MVGVYIVKTMHTSVEQSTFLGQVALPTICHVGCHNYDILIVITDSRDILASPCLVILGYTVIIYDVGSCYADMG